MKAGASKNLLAWLDGSYGLTHSVLWEIHGIARAVKRQDAKAVARVHLEPIDRPIDRHENPRAEEEYQDQRKLIHHYFEGKIWSGARTYQILPKSCSRVHEAQRRVTIEAELKSFVRENLHAKKMNIAYFSGHGDGTKQVVGMKIDTLSKNLLLAQQQAGCLLDLIVFVACEMATMEAAKKMNGCAKIMLASQTVVYGAPEDEEKEHWTGVFASLSEPSADKIAETMMECLYPQTYTILDLTQVDNLGKMLDNLGSEALAEHRKTKASPNNYDWHSIDRAIHSGRHPYERISEDRADLGIVLQELEQTTSGGVLEAVRQAHHAFKSTILSSTADRDCPGATGLSFVIPEVKFLNPRKQTGWESFIMTALALGDSY